MLKMPRGKLTCHNVLSLSKAAQTWGQLEQEGWNKATYTCQSATVKWIIVLSRNVRNHMTGAEPKYRQMDRCSQLLWWRRSWAERRGSQFTGQSTVLYSSLGWIERPHAFKWAILYVLTIPMTPYTMTPSLPCIFSIYLHSLLFPICPTCFWV